MTTNQETAVTDTRPRCPVDIDLVDPDTFENGLPLEAFATMREQAPVFWHEQPGTCVTGPPAPVKKTQCQASREIMNSWTLNGRLTMRTSPNQP